MVFFPYNLCIFVWMQCSGLTNIGSFLDSSSRVTKRLWYTFTKKSLLWFTKIINMELKSACIQQMLWSDCIWLIACQSGTRLPKKDGYKSLNLNLPVRLHLIRKDKLWRHASKFSDVSVHLNNRVSLFLVLESIKDKPELQKVHLGLPKEELEDQMKRQIEE